MQVFGERIPAAKMAQFHEILCATGGRYLSEPRAYGDMYRVDYAPGDYKEHCTRWQRATTSIREVRHDQTWRTVFRRIISFFKVI